MLVPEGLSMFQNFRAIANYFIDKARSEDKMLTHMQIQKLLYFAHGIYLAIYKSPLIDKTFQAWKHGPVIPELYFDLSPFGSNGIKKKLTEVCHETGKSKICEPVIHLKDQKVLELLNFIWEQFGGYDGLKLSYLTHVKDSPWDKNYDPNFRNKMIPNEDIFDYFKDKVKKT